MTGTDNNFQQSHTWNEILSQGDTWAAVINELGDSSGFRQALEAAAKIQECFFIGCGTSFYLAEAASFSWTVLTGQPSRALPASDVLLYPKAVHPNQSKAQAIVISRSGQTSEGVRAASVLRKDVGLPTVGITCASNSDLERACDHTLVLHSADESSTVMTRSFTSMLVSLQVLAARTAGKAKFADNLRANAQRLGSRIHSIAEQVKAFVNRHTFTDYVFLGQGPFHGIAREAALKVMEMSCSYSQFFHTLEFRHGPKAIVSPATCLTFFLSDSGYQAEAEVLEEMKALEGTTVAICRRADEELRRSCDLVIELDFDGNELALLAPYIIPCQLMGFFTGIGKGLNPDLPKNLSRVVILD